MTLNPRQFQLFMFAPASQLADPKQVVHNDVTAYSVNRGVREESAQAQVSKRKLKEAKFSGLHDSIAREGVREPVEMGPGNYSPPRGSFRGARDKPKLYNGHHRVFAANDINPRMEIPVSWH